MIHVYDAWLKKMALHNSHILPPFLNISLFRDFKWTTTYACIQTYFQSVDSLILFRMQSLIEISKKTYIWEWREYKTSSTQHPDVPFLVVSEKFMFFQLFIGGQAAKNRGKRARFLADAPPRGSLLLLGRRESMLFNSFLLRELCSSFSQHARHLASRCMCHARKWR